MKRNLDLIREMMLEMEEWEGPVDIAKLVKRPRNVVVTELGEREYHYHLMLDAGWIIQFTEGEVWACWGLSWEGHDFLDSIRDPSHWARAKQYFSDRGLEISTMPMPIVKEVALNLLKALILPNG